MGRRKVCLFCEKWASGGIESLLSNVLRPMDLSKLEVDIVAAELCGSVFTRPLEELGVRFEALSGDQRDLGRNHRQFKKLLDRRRYDVVHVNAFQALSLFYLRQAREAGTPVRIAHSHNTALRESPTRAVKLALHRWGRERYAGEATDLWACSSAAAEFLFPKAELARRGFRFIPNGIDAARFRFDGVERERVRKELGLDGKLVVGNVGRLCDQKNQAFLLEVFREVHSRRPESALLLIGEGEDRQRLEEKAKRLGLEDRVIFYGAADRVERLYWSMDVFMLPSRFEGLPVTGIEAQAAGLPCLFSDAVTRECQIEKSARFLPLSDPGKWAETTLRADGTADRRESAAALRAAGFDIGDVAHGIEDFYLRADEHG